MSSGSDSRFQIGRRDFLVLSSTAALGVAASGFASEVASRFSAPRPFSIGFTDGTHRLISASGLPHALRGDLARVTVNGFWSGDGVSRSTALAAYFPHDGNDRSFLAWNHIHRADAPAPRASFRMPLQSGALALAFESRDPLPRPKDEPALIAAANADRLLHAAGDRETSARCMLNARRGTYVVAFDAKPDWRSLQLGTGDRPLGNVSFDYLVFTVDQV
ncbi:MAG TPA: hypothetical protein VJ901_05695 [Thermoanaerobaculia bacterium]|nr:hypothetical protein [Thermoanaerobaculia bacterium]